jgi:hypothetical protein
MTERILVNRYVSEGLAASISYSEGGGVGLSETIILIYQTTRRDIPEHRLGLHIGFKQHNVERIEISDLTLPVCHSS